MEKSSTSVFDLLNKSWEIVSKNWQLFAFVNILSLLSAASHLFYNPDIEASQTLSQNTLANLIVFGRDLNVTFDMVAGVIAIAIVATLFFQIMLLGLELKSTADNKTNIDELLTLGARYFLPVIALYIVSSVIIFAGLILLFLPGIFAIVRLIYAPYFLIDKKLSVIESIKASNRLSAENTGATIAALALSVAVAIGFSAFSAIPYVGALIGTIGAIASSLIIVLRYRELTN